MRKRTFVIFTLLFISFSLVSQVGILTDTPNPSAALDIDSDSLGILAPRVALSIDLTSPYPILNPAEGLLVYNSGSNQQQGFYYWSGTEWKYIDSPKSDLIMGPGLSTDNAVVRWDGTTGKIIQNSTVLLSDDGNLTDVNNIQVTGFTMPTMPIDGYTLVSDNVGNGSWQIAPAIDIEEEDILITQSARVLNFIDTIRVQNNGGGKSTITFYKNNVTRSLIQLSSRSWIDLNTLDTANPVAIPWNKLDQKDNGAYVHSTTNNPSRIQVLKHGIYEFNYMFSAVSRTLQRKTLRARLRKNGQEYIPNVVCYSFHYNIDTIRSSHVSSSFLVELDANDYIELVTNGQTNPGPLTLVPFRNVFFIRLIREL